MIYGVQGNKPCTKKPPFFWCTNCFYKTPEIRHFIILYPCTKKRWFFGAWGVVCGIGAANAELPENVKFCIPKQYTITYDCGNFDGIAPQGTQIAYGQMFTTPTNTACGGVHNRWRVDDSDTLITTNTTIPYSYVHDIKLTAVVDMTYIDMTIAADSIEYKFNENIYRCDECQNGEFIVHFNYDTIRGRAACVGSVDEYNSIYRGATYFYLDNPQLDGFSCFCQMTSLFGTKTQNTPFVRRSYTGSCVPTCAQRCAEYISNDFTTRTFFYNSINYSE